MPVSGGGPYIKYGFEVGEGMLVSGGGPYKLWLAWGCLLKKLTHTQVTAVRYLWCKKREFNSSHTG